MYRIEIRNQIKGYVNNLTYIKQQKNGYYSLCSEEEAQGVVLNGKVYQLFNKPQIDSEEALTTVNITKIDDYKYYLDKLSDENAQTLETQTALAELSILISTLLEGNGNNV